MTCKHEWIKHSNNELLEMCRLCDKERTKGKESQKIPDIALSKGEIVTESCSTKKCVGKECSSLPLKIFVGVLGFVVFAGGVGGMGCTNTNSLKLLVAQAQRDCPLSRLNRLINTARRTTV